MSVDGQLIGRLLYHAEEEIDIRQGGARFTPTQREAVLAKVASLDRRGFGQHEIARQVGVSQPMACNYLKKIREHHLATQIMEREL